MKLRNKKTGEIRGIKEILIDGMFTVNSLAELNEEWEDYKEPKEFWYIDYDGGILCSDYHNSSTEKMMISMGNHFGSIEEAEKAVEKLKAWKRLKDKGIIDLISIEMKTSEIAEGEICTIRFHTTDKQVETDLKLLLGGEE